MKDKGKIKIQTEGSDGSRDCNCGDNCCPPKKKSTLPKLIFSIILLAALCIILVKLFYQPSPAPAALNQQIFRDPNSPVWCDTSGTAACDTTKGSSCCPH